MGEDGKVGEAGPLRPCPHGCRLRAAHQPTLSRVASSAERTNSLIFWPPLVAHADSKQRTKWFHRMPIIRGEFARARPESLWLFAAETMPRTKRIFLFMSRALNSAEYTKFHPRPRPDLLGPGSLSWEQRARARGGGGGSSERAGARKHVCGALRERARAAAEPSPLSLFPSLSLSPSPSLPLHQSHSLTPSVPPPSLTPSLPSSFSLPLPLSPSPRLPPASATAAPRSPS